MEKLFMFLLGLGVGAGTAYLITRRHYKLKIEDIQKDILGRELNNSEERPERRRDKEVENMSFDDGVGYSLDFLHTICRDDEEEIGVLVDRLQKLGVGISYGEDYEEDEREEVNPTDSDEDDSIYIIDAKEYDENDSFSKEIITFYEEDQTFVDPESSEVIEKWRQYFGADILNWIEDHNWRKENLYVRNMTYKSDYQFVHKETSYAAENGEVDEYQPGDFADKRH